MYCNIHEFLHWFFATFSKILLKNPRLRPKSCMITVSVLHETESSDGCHWHQLDVHKESFLYLSVVNCHQNWHGWTLNREQQRTQNCEILTWFNYPESREQHMEAMLFSFNWFFGNINCIMGPLFVMGFNSSVLCSWYR